MKIGEREWSRKWCDTKIDENWSKCVRCVHKAMKLFFKLSARSKLVVHDQNHVAFAVWSLIMIIFSGNANSVLEIFRIYFLLMPHVGNNRTELSIFLRMIYLADLSIVVQSNSGNTSLSQLEWICSIRLLTKDVLFIFFGLHSIDPAFHYATVLVPHTYRS